MQHNFEDADMINRRWRTLRRPRGGEHRDEACPVHKAAARDAGDLTVPADCISRITISRCFRHGPQALKAYPDRNKVPTLHPIKCSVAMSGEHWYLV
jgi:hypothetical protein